MEWKLQKDKRAELIDYSSIPVIETATGRDYMKEVEGDKRYSLEVDPDGKYRFDDDTKRFIETYCEYKNLAVVTNMLQMDPAEAKSLMSSYCVVSEIRRINVAQYHRRIATKMMTLDDIGGWLTSLVSEENLPIGDVSSPKTKLEAVKMLMDLNKYKAEAYSNSDFIDMSKTESLEEKVSQLSVDEIKQLLYADAARSKVEEMKKKKDDLIAKIDPDRGKLTAEERSVLETLPIEDLEMLVAENGSPSSRFREMLKKSREAEAAASAPKAEDVPKAFIESQPEGSVDSALRAAAREQRESASKEVTISPADVTGRHESH